MYLFTQTSTTFALFIDYLFLGSFIDCIRVAPAGYYLFTDLFTTLLIALKSSMRHLLCVIIYHLFIRQDIFIICVYSSFEPSLYYYFTYYFVILSPGQCLTLLCDYHYLLHLWSSVIKPRVSSFGILMNYYLATWLSYLLSSFELWSVDGVMCPWPVIRSTLAMVSYRLFYFLFSSHFFLRDLWRRCWWDRDFCP